MPDTLTPTPFPKCASTSISAMEIDFSGGVDRFFEQSPLATWIFDLETLKLLSVNAAAVHQYGWSREEYLGMSADQIMPPSAHAAFRSDVAELRSSKDRVRTSSDCPILTKAGTVRRVE